MCSLLHHCSHKLRHRCWGLKVGLSNKLQQSIQRQTEVTIKCDDHYQFVRIGNVALGDWGSLAGLLSSTAYYGIEKKTSWPDHSFSLLLSSTCQTGSRADRYRLFAHSFMHTPHHWFTDVRCSSAVCMYVCVLLSSMQAATCFPRGASVHLVPLSNQPPNSTKAG